MKLDCCHHCHHPYHMAGKELKISTARNNQLPRLQTRLRGCGSIPVQFFGPQAVSLPSPAPSNTVVINARCSEDQRVIVVAGLPVHHYRAEDLVAEAYAIVFLVASGFAQQSDVARAFGRSVRTI